MNPNGCLARCLRALVTVCGLGLGPSVLSAQKALVYCPVGIDPTGCTTLVQALGDSGGPFPQRVDMGYDGTAGTIDLTSADLSPYAVFIVPALADNADAKPYDLLRTATVANRLRNVLLGRIAVWSGTPDQGSLSRAQKNTLVRNLAAWGAANYATSGLRGLVVLQDYSDSVAQRYAWVAAISRLGVTADSAPGIYSEVQALTATATGLLNNGGQQLAYANMASFGIEPPGDSSGATADARGGTSGGQVVLVSSLGYGNGAATVKTDRADYAPGQVVTITGSGWQVGEVVSLVLHEDPPIDTHPTLTATADASGHIFNNTFAPDAHDVDVRFYLTATGQTSASVAQATFTDDNFAVSSVSPASGRTLGGTPVTITGTSFTSGRQPFTVAFGVGAPVSAARVDNQTLTATTPAHTAGIVDVIVTGNANQGNAASVTLTNGFTFTRVNPTVSFTLAPVSAVYQSSFTVASSTNSSASPVYTSGPVGVCSNVGTTYTMTSGTGTCTSTVTWAADASYNGATLSQFTTASKAPQTISFTSTAPSNAVYGGPTYSVSATGGGSGNAVTFGSSTPAICAVSGGTTSFVGVGLCTVTAIQAGNDNYSAATQATQSFAVGKRALTVTADAKSKTYGDADPGLTYQISSGSLVTGDVFTGALSRAAGENVGLHAIGQGTLALSTNYTLTYVGADLTISKRAVTATADAKSKTYGDANPGLTYQITSGSLVTGDAFTGALGRAAGENVGSYAVGQNTLALSGNYTLTYVGADLTITKRAVTVTADAKSKTYGDADAGLTYQITAGALAFSDAFTGALSRAAGENVGTYAIAQNTLALSTNYTLTYAGANLTITPRAVAVAADAKSKTYGDADPALTYQITSGSLAFSDAFTGSLSRAAGENVGLHAIGQGTLALSTNYALTYAGADLTITKRAVTVTADAKSKTYGDADPALTYQITSGSLAFSDAFTGSLTRAAGDNVGTYAIAQNTLALSTNYTLTYAGANLTITPRAVAVAADAKSKTYGDADPALTYQITSGSLAFSDAFTGSLSRAAGENVGLHAIGQGTLALSTNYALTYAGADLTIDARAVRVTADAKSKTYGDADPGLTYQITSGSLVTGDGFTGALGRAAGENVGSYAIQQGTLALSTNYTLTYVGADLTISKRAVTATADAKSKTYGDADPGLTYQITSGSLVTGDAFTGALGRAAGENVGSYTIQQGTLALSTNYALTYAGADLTIDARAVAVAADAKSKTYGDADPALTYQITAGSLAFSDAFTGALSRAAGENVGTYTIQQGTLALSTNYALTYAGANLTIDARAVRVTADAKSKTYGDADPGLTYQITSGSLVTGDGFTGALGRAAGENVGSYAIQQGTLALSTNYTLTYAGAHLTIGARAVTVTADAKSKTYGDADPALTYQITSGSLAFSDAFTGVLIRATGEAVGSYAIGQNTLALSGNYTLAYVGANLTIGARAVTVTADAKSKTYGDADPALTYQITAGSLAFSDAFTGALSRATGEAVGSYAIGQNTLALNGNYTLAYVGANLTIGARAVTVTADAKSKTYGDADPGLTYQITSGSLVTGDGFTGVLSRAAGENLGSYAIQQGTLALSTNYALAYAGADLTIGARAVTVTADAKSKTYGDADPALTYQITAGSLAFSDAFTGALSRAAGENVGTYAIAQNTLALSTNYTLTYAGANLTITPRAVAVAADAKSKTYGDADPEIGR